MTDETKASIKLVVDLILKFTGPVALFAMGYSLNYLINVESRLDSLEVSRAVVENTLSLEIQHLRDAIISHDSRGN